jgi:hypothetical protein
LVLSAAGEQVVGATSAAEGISQILPPFHYLHHRMDEFAALPFAFLRPNSNCTEQH